MTANAVGKARSVVARSGVPSGGAVLGADTEVVLGDRAFGKPADEARATAMLAALAGRTHEVVTAVCLITARGEVSEADRTLVTMRRLPPAALRWYVDTGEWRERAGGYAIQGAGAALVERIDGDYTTVVGLPIGRLVVLLTVLGIGPWRAPGD